jgi:hypothetical protein
MLVSLFLAALVQGATTLFAPILERPSGAVAKLSPLHDLPAVLAAVSAPLVGRPYLKGPLGEGSKAPLYRLDGFDCTTFVETVMANAYCFPGGSPSCLNQEMERIRYRGSEVAFGERNHVPELDWLPNNVRRGYLRDLSASLFGGEWRRAIPTIHREEWLVAQGEKGINGPAEAAPPLRYLPVSYFFRRRELSPELQRELDAKLAHSGEAAAQEIKPDEAARIKFRGELAFLRATYEPVPGRLEKIPAGTVLNLVRAPFKDLAKARLTPLVAHQGLILQGKEGPLIRHAAPNVGHVAEQALADYLLRYIRSAHFRGISLFEILPAPEFTVR